MTEDRPTHSESRAAIALTVLAGCAIVLFGNAYTPLNTDLGWMLDFGRTAAKLGHIPAMNGRSFIDGGHPLVLHEWGACLLFYFVHSHWGAAGLIAVRWALAVAVVGVVAGTIRRITAIPIARFAATILAAGALASSGGLQLVRPQLFSLLLLATVIHLGLFGNRRTLWWCPPLFIVWANLHGGWVAGVAALWGICGARGIEQRLGTRPVTVPDATLAGVPFVSMLALTINPYGTGLIVHTLHHVSDDIRLLNREWTPLLAQPMSSYQTVSAVCIGAAILFAFASVSIGRFSVLVPMLLGAIASLSAMRNVRVAPLLMAPAGAAGLDRLAGLARPRINRLVPVLAGTTAAMFLFPLAAGKGLFEFQPFHGPDPGTALWVMRENKLTGGLWSDFDWGGTILWALPDVQVGCDGRNVAAYSEETLRACMLFGNAPDPAVVLHKYGAELALIPRSYPRLGQLERDFPPVYCDTETCILSSTPRVVLIKPGGAVTAASLMGGSR